MLVLHSFGKRFYVDITFQLRSLQLQIIICFLSFFVKISIYLLYFELNFQQIIFVISV